jgi:hypothetical protein
MWGGLNRLQGVGLSVLNQAVSGGAKLLERIDGDMEGALEGEYEDGSAGSDVYDSQDEATAAAAIDDEQESHHGDTDAAQQAGAEEAGKKQNLNICKCNHLLNFFCRANASCWSLLTVL